MPIFYKSLILIIFLMLAVGSVLYFLPAEKKEIKTAFQPESTETIVIPENQKRDEGIKNIPEEISKNEEAPKEKNNNSEKDSRKSEIKIVQHPVNWGYANSKTRFIDTLILHSSYNALGGDFYDLDKLLKEYQSYGVAPHYLIDRKGTIYQLTKDQNVAYHAGESKMPDGRTNVNNFSLGIELMNTESDKMTDNQYQSLNQLIGYIKESYNIKNILGHNQIAPQRKTDPWNFNWDKIRPTE